MSIITEVFARQILDSRGNPTVEAEVVTENGIVGRAAVPSGASTGVHEAVELRDGDQSRYMGKGVLTAVENINTIINDALVGEYVFDQNDIDRIMLDLDGTDNKGKLGANAILAVSLAVAKAAAEEAGQPLYRYIGGVNANTLPIPLMNILNGGSHADNSIDFQEFMIVPPIATSYSSNLKVGTEIYYALKDVITNHSGVTLVGDEGGYAPVLYTNVDAIKLLEEAVQKAGYSLGLDAFFSLDVAASYFLAGSEYKIKDKPVPLKTKDFIDFYEVLDDQFHILSLEDPLSEDDWDGWQELTKRLGSKTIIVGDDLITTNLERLKKAVEKKSCNAVIIKPNQVGTISETIEVVKAAKAAGLKLVVSHRSGETNEDFIADFAVGIGAEYAKFGAPARGERVAKYNRLLEIEYELS